MPKLSPVTFHGDTIYCVTILNRPYTPAKTIIENLGLDWMGQYRKLTENSERWGIVMIAIPSTGGVQQAVCIPLRKLPAFLASINPKKVRPELRAKIELYQNECDEALWEYWMEGEAIRKPRPLKKPEQLPLSPSSLSAPIDEKPFLEFINEIQSAHEEVSRILSNLHHSVFTLSWKVAEALEQRADIRLYLVPEMLSENTLRGYLHQSVYHDVTKALTAPGRQLEEYSNPGYSLLGIVRQLNAR